jgi:hypothetical protein
MPAKKNFAGGHVPGRCRTALSSLEEAPSGARHSPLSSNSEPGKSTMTRMLALTTALIAAIAIGQAMTDEARAQPAPAGRRVILADASPGSELRTERRIALVVGNSNYDDKKMSLSNPQHDANDVAQALKKLGFDVLTAIDARKQEFERTLAEFARKGKNADMALFFYAGHAMQHQGRNYLMPVDGELKDGDSIWSMIRLDDVREALDRVSGLKVMILDACRNNPLSDRLYRAVGGGGDQRGLARVDRTQGMIVVYATAADDVAEDGNGHNSPFTSALLTRMDEGGLEITKMLKLVGADVSADTAGRQRPEISVQSYNDYFLNQSDRSAWDKIRDSGDASALEDFIRRFPSSPYSPVARDRVQRLALSTPAVPLKPAAATPDDQSVTKPGPALTLPPAPRLPPASQGFQPAGAMTGEPAPSLPPKAPADATPSRRPDKTEANSDFTPPADPASNGSGKSSGSNIHKAVPSRPDPSHPDPSHPDAPRRGNKSGDASRPGAASQSAMETAKTRSQQGQQNETAKNTGRTSMMIGHGI